MKFIWGILIKNIKYLKLSLLVLLNLSLQFAFQWLIIVVLGPGNQTDAFFGVITVPTMVLNMLSTSLTMVLVPMFSTADKNREPVGAWDIFCSIGLLFLVVASILYISANWWVPIILPGFTADKLTMAINLGRIQLIGMIFSALLSVVWAVHASKNNFLFIETTSILANTIVLVILIIFQNRISIYLMTWLSVFRVFMEVVFLSTFFKQLRLPNFKSDIFKSVWKKLRPLLIGNAYYKTDPVIDKYLLSSQAAGKLTIFDLAQNLYKIGSTITIKVFVNTMVPSIAMAAKANDTIAVRKIFFKRLLLIAVIGVFSIVMLILIGKPILAAVLKYKSFTSENTIELWSSLLLLSGYWVGGILGSVTASTFYAMGNYITPTRIGAICFTLFIPLKVFFYYKFGITGLATAISIYYITSFLIQFAFLNKILKYDSGQT